MDIADVGAGRDRADWNLAICDVSVQLEAAPILQVPLRTFLGADRTFAGQLRNHRWKCHVTWPICYGSTFGYLLLLWA